MRDDRKMAVEVAKAINYLDFNNGEFCAEMLNQHRTIQQCFTRLCLKWIQTCANLEDHQYDGRNEDSVRVCREIMENNPEGFYLPMI